MAITPEEFWQALTGEADEPVRKRVLQAIEEGDPGVLKIIEQRKKRAAVWLKLLDDQRPGVADLGIDATAGVGSKEREDA